LSSGDVMNTPVVVMGQVPGRCPNVVVVIIVVVVWALVHAWKSRHIILLLLLLLLRKGVFTGAGQPAGRCERASAQWANSRIGPLQSCQNHLLLKHCVYSYSSWLRVRPGGRHACSVRFRSCCCEWSGGRWMSEPW
jgi:hypothetical protein